jgi:hypothetical protein
MTDRTNSLMVVLDKEYRTDDAQIIIDAISMIKGVLNVSCNIADNGEFAAKEQAKHELRNKLWELLR